MSASSKVMSPAKRGFRATQEMHAKGYLTTQELSRKLKKSLGCIKSCRQRGRIKGVYHKGSNMWFYAADTKFPYPEPTVPKPGPEVGVSGSVMLGGPWVCWPAPGFVTFSMMGLKRNYQVESGKSLGWLGGP